MKLSMSALSLLFLVAVAPQEEKQPVVYVKHLEPPLHYPPLARLTRLQGTVVVKLTIGADRTVLTAESLTRDQDSRANALPPLRVETEKLVKKWTFGCAYCLPNLPYEKTIKFIYRLEGEETSHDDTRVVMELPDEIIITAGPPVCDHCPPKKIIPLGPA